MSAPAVGQTRPGRLGEPAPAGAGVGSAGGAQPAANPRQFIEELVRGHRAVIFSKVICPSSRKAKEIMSGRRLPAGQLAVVELDQRPDGGRLQDELEAMTGKRTVPNVWIGGQFVGGADDLAALESSGQLAARLGV